MHAREVPVKRTATFSASAIAVFSTALFSAPSDAQDINFAGKKLEMYIGSTAGGGTDLSSRLVGDFVARHLPGKPAIVYRNMPGGQGLKALNHFSTRVKADGLSMAGGSQGHIDQAARKQSAVQFDPLALAYFGGLSRGGTMFVIRKTSMPRLETATAKPLVFPAVELASTGPQLALWAKEYLGWNFKIVLGYSGTPAMIMAGLNGEADAMASSSSLQLKPLMESGEFVHVLQMGEMDDAGKVTSRAALAGVPLFTAMIEPKLPADKRDTFRSWLQAQYLDKFFALPPNTPPAFTAAYTEAFAKAVVDPDFIKAARQQFGNDFKHATGPVMTRMINDLVRSVDTVSTHMQDLRRKHGLPAE